RADARPARRRDRARRRRQPRRARARAHRPHHRARADARGRGAHARDRRVDAPAQAQALRSDMTEGNRSSSPAAKRGRATLARGNPRGMTRTLQLRTRLAIAGSLLIATTVATGVWSVTAFRRVSRVAGQTVIGNERMTDATARLTGALERED